MMTIPPATLAAALGAAERLFHTPRAHIIGHSRARGLMLVRHALTAALRDCGASWPALGHALDRDPSTAQHSVKAARARAARDAEYAAAIETITREARAA